MSPWILLSAASFLVLATLHSVLGERVLLRPLFASDAFAKLAIGHKFARRTFRFAWHLTSVTWLGLAALVVAVDGPASRGIIAGLSLVSGLYIAIASRGQHLAWPVFGLGALGAARAAGLGAEAGPVIGAILGAVLIAIALLHVFWALGGEWGLSATVPSHNDQPLFVPGAIATLVVIAGLFGLAALALVLGGLVHVDLAPEIVRPFAAASGAIFLLRAFGDLRSVGVLKRLRGTPFARWDDRLYTPLCFLLSAGFWVLLDVGPLG